jgi:hypothetical protein
MTASLAPQFVVGDPDEAARHDHATSGSPARTAAAGFGASRISAKRRPLSPAKRHRVSGAGTDADTDPSPPAKAAKDEPA